MTISKILRLWCAMALTATTFHAAAEVVRPTLDALPKAETPELELVLEGIVDLGEWIEVGETAKGLRGIAPITGGEFQGRNGFKATVKPGGADWQLARTDGVWEIFALYSITTDDGVNIVIDNRGVAVNKSDDPKLPADEWYIATNPTFLAPDGKYSWLKQSQFAGTVVAAADESYVIVRVYEILQ